jgi:glycosyltransferase involved in cell wall biosynthesis
MKGHDDCVEGNVIKFKGKQKVAFISTYPPRACGIATFTQDLVRALDPCFVGVQPTVIAVSNAPMDYSKRVTLEIDQSDRASYRKAACALNEASLDIVVLEHEYGIFGGENGEFILDFVDHLQVPLVTTLHTVLPNPLPKQAYILKELGNKSTKIVTMAYVTKTMLRDIYDIPENKIVVIPHGVPAIPQTLSRKELKTSSGFAGRSVISTFGLLSPGKGLEYGIKAIAMIAEKHPEVLYLILGQTHPCVKEAAGEEYREDLEKLVKKLHVEKQVRFVNRYLSKKEIVQYLCLSDIYMTPYLDRNQAVSGTLAYAAGYGKVIISTPYKYAQEILAEGRGLLAEFADAEALAKQIDDVLMHPEKKKSMEEKTSLLGQAMMWENVAAVYAKLFEEIAAGVNKESLVV